MKIKTLLTILFLCVITNGKGILDQYDSYTLDDSCFTISSFYRGSLYSSGLANSEMKAMIKEMKPEKIGNIDSNSITLFGDEDYKEEKYTFEKIIYYEVSVDTSDFYVMLIQSKRNNEDYTILIELREGPYFHRTMTIYKDNKPYTMILWYDKSLISTSSITRGI